MKHSATRMLTTHTGSLPRPADLTNLLIDAQARPGSDRAALDAAVQRAMAKDFSWKVAAAGYEQLPKDLDVMGALLAGTFATTREIARMREESDFRTLFQQGD